MAEIFVSHSKQDNDFVNFFSRAFAVTKVNAKLKEIDSIDNLITSNETIQDIERSNAIFVIVSQNVQNLPHTRDWVVWETGVAKNKDIWIFEPYSQLGKVSVLTPYLRHYVLFEITEEWLGYLRIIIESYDDSQTLGTTLLTTAVGVGIGALVSDEKNKGGAMTLGGLGGGICGLSISDKSRTRPNGLNIWCAKCYSSYNIHLPGRVNKYRCPACNSYLIVNSVDAR